MLCLFEFIPQLLCWVKIWALTPQCRFSDLKWLCIDLLWCLGSLACCIINFPWSSAVGQRLWCYLVKYINFETMIMIDYNDSFTSVAFTLSFMFTSLIIQLIWFQMRKAEWSILLRTATLWNDSKHEDATCEELTQNVIQCSFSDETAGLLNPDSS